MSVECFLSLWYLSGLFGFLMIPIFEKSVKEIKIKDVICSFLFSVFGPMVFIAVLGVAGVYDKVIWKRKQ